MFTDYLTLQYCVLKKGVFAEQVFHRQLPTCFSTDRTHIIRSFRMPRARNLRVNLRTSHPMNTQPKNICSLCFPQALQFLQPDLTSRISFRVWQSILDWRYTDKLRCSLGLLSSQLNLTRSQDLTSHPQMYTGLCAPCQGKFGVADGISPIVSWGFPDLLLKAIVKMLRSCSLKQIQSATHTQSPTSPERELQANLSDFCDISCIIPNADVPLFYYV